MTLDNWLSFAIIWTLAGLPLGPNAVHTITVTIKHGYPKCFYSPLGMALACVIHATIASAGVGALLLMYPNLLIFLKLFGAAYLCWLGIKLWCSEPKVVELNDYSQSEGKQIVLAACLVSLVNPKAILSYVAVFAPFISLQAAVIPQLLILIPTATIIVFFNYVGYSLLAWPIRRWMNSDAKRKLFNRISGTMFVGFAGLLALSTKRTNG